LDEYASSLHEWAEWWSLVETVLAVVRRQGHSLQTPALLAAELPASYAYPSSHTLAKELQEFVAGQSADARIGECLPGSSEVLESTFGRFKELERDQVHGGFTGLLTALGALVGQVNDASRNIGENLFLCGVKNLAKWI